MDSELTPDETFNQSFELGRLRKISRMYRTYQFSHDNCLSFIEYAFLFHEIPRQEAQEWWTSGTFSIEHQKKP